MNSNPFRYLLFAAILIIAGSAYSQNARIPEWIKKEKFLRACETADIEAVKNYLKQGISPDTRDIFGQPAILRAVRGFDVFRNTPEVIRLLLAAGADINATNEFGSTALFGTVRMPDTPMNPQGLLLRSGADVNKKDKYGKTYAERKYYDDHEAVEDDDMAWRLLLEDDINWSAPWETVQKMPRHSNSATAMMAASYYGIVFGRTPDRYKTEWQVEVDKNGETYLFYFASRPQLYTDELFSLDHRAVNKVSKKGDTALMRAVMFDNGWLVKRLMSAGAEVDRRDLDAKNALEYAAEYDYFDSTLLLLGRAFPNLPNKKGRTALMVAAANGSINTMRAYSYALQFAARAPAEAAKLPRAERKQMLELAALFRKIDLNVKDQDGMTALMLAAEGGHTEIVKTFVLLKANAKLTNIAGKTALDLARAKGHKDIVKLLTAGR
ncbi:MAG: ankyrin repeat domain-containing protein [Acidobacteria bacterium]|nr:ankyrin repeat domain-containing protein [Acidobacteriota bacterium]